MIRNTTTNQLIERYHQSLYWHIRRIVISHENTEDVLQNTFLQVHLHLNELQNAASERAWIYRIATNEALQWIRKQHNHISLDTDEAMVATNGLLAEPDIDTFYRLVVVFQEAIQALPTKQRTIFTLRYYDELPYEEIALITDSTVGAAKTNYHIAKEKISNYILTHS